MSPPDEAGIPASLHESGDSLVLSVEHYNRLWDRGRITDDRSFGDVLKNFLFDQCLRGHRNAEELIKRGE